MRFVVCLMLISLSPSVNAQTADEIIFKFNLLAGEAFIKKNYTSSEELSKLSGEERCFLEKTITSYLDDLNNSSLNVIDSFYVRSYYSGVLGFHFSFIATVAGKFYFMYASQWEEYKWNDNKAYKSDELGLKDSLGNFIVKLSIPFLDDFVKEEINNKTHPDIHRQSGKMCHLLQYMFPSMLNREISLVEFQLEIGKRNEQQYSEIVKVLNPLIYHAHPNVLNDRGANNFQIFENVLGYVFIDYEHSSPSKKDLQLDMYFVPHDKKPGRFMKDAEPARYIDCLKKFNGN
jgi:hypothetical protein